MKEATKYLIAEDCFIHHQKENETDCYYLISNLRNMVLKVNETIADFVALLEKPNSQDDLIALLDETPTETIEIQISGFLKELYRLGIIRKIDDKPLPDQDYIFEKGQEVHGYAILERRLSRRWTQLYQVQEIASKQRYILKLFNYSKNEIESKVVQETLNLFIREFDMMAQLQHPNVCALHRFHQEDYYFAIIEYIEGDDLKKHLEKVTRLQEAEALALQLLEAFAYLHQARMLHGDIHYRNILVDQNNVLKVIDFGFSYLDHTINDKDAWHGGVPNFIPPERVREHSYRLSKKVGDFRSEVFQIGVLLYFLMNGDAPFSGTLWKELADSIRYQSITEIPYRYSDTLSEAKEHIIFKALEKDPAARFADAGAFLEAWKNAS